MVTKTVEELDEMGDAEKAAYFAAEEKAVFGHNVEHDRHGRPIEKGIGAPGRETLNHFRAIRVYEGEEAYSRACAEMWKRDSERAQKLNLPRPKAN